MAAQKFKYLVIHTLDTPSNREVTADDIQLWHLGALNNGNGTYTFLGKKYTLEQLKTKFLILRSGKSINAARTNGRGWTKVGYSDFIQRSGNLVNLIPYNSDAIIDTWEISNGATGYNACSRHISLAGGWTPDGNKTGKDSNGIYLKPEVLYTEAQLKQLLNYIKAWREIIPDVTIIGHNQIAKKTCPNFDVQLWLQENGISNPINNITSNKF